MFRVSDGAFHIYCLQFLSILYVGTGGILLSFLRLIRNAGMMVGCCAFWEPCSCSSL